MCVIKCPKCGYQYLPGEIFIPNALVGEPKNIVRNTIGEILGYEGTDPELNESYVCDHCNQEFNIVAKLSFSTDSKEGIVENLPQQISLFD